MVRTYSSKQSDISSVYLRLPNRIRIRVKIRGDDRYYYFKHPATKQWVRFRKQMQKYCWGCRTDPPQPNQMAHMDPGGCLSDEPRILPYIKTYRTNMQTLSQLSGLSIRDIHARLGRIRLV